MTTLVSTTFTGSDGAAWPAPWTTLGGTPTIVSNRGQQVTAATAWTGAESRANLTLPAGRVDATVRFPALTNVSMRINVRYDPNTGNGYRLIVPTDYAGFQLLRVDGWTETPICEDFTLTWAANTDYQIAVSFSGGMVRAKRWLTSGSEPTIWQLTAVDSTYTTGDVCLVTVSGATASAATGLWDNVVIGDVANTLDAARVGYHNDGFLGAFAELGTFTTFSPSDEATTRAYVQADAGVPMGHESAGVNSPTSDWANASTELAAYHFSYLSPDYHPSVLASWGSTNVTTVARNLGYRLRLTTATLPSTAAAGAGMAVSLTFTNDGYAAAHRGRPAQLVFVNGATVVTRTLALDVRTITPGSTVTASETVTAPTAGSWTMHLLFPDAVAGLASVPAYAIQLANTGVWDSATGRNALGRSVAVS